MSYPKLIKQDHLPDEEAYRALPNEIRSYSQFKTFDISRNKYYREYVLGEKDFEMNQDMLLGSLVDCLLTCPDEFDNRYHMMTGNAPTGQWGEYITTLSKVCRQYLKNGKFTIEFTEIMRIAFELFKEENPDKFKGKDFDYIVLNYSKEDSRSKIVPRDYFQQCLDNIEKIPVDLAMSTRAAKVKDSLVYGKYTAKLFQTSSSRTSQTAASSTDVIDVYSQFPLQFEYKGQMIKILIDRLEVNHTTKTVKVYDIKCVWDSTGFGYNYLKARYYIQAGLYHFGVSTLMDQLPAEYKLDPNFYFIVADTTLNYNACIYKITTEQLQDAFNGFEDSRGRKWNGIDEIIADIVYCDSINDYKDCLALNQADGVLSIQI